MTAGMTRKFPTKAVLAERLLIRNSNGLAALGPPPQVYIAFLPQDLGREAVCARYQVRGIGFSTDPHAHWTDHGHETFNVIGRPKKEMLCLAMVWAEQRYGVAEWIRDPFGDYQDGRVLMAVRRRLNLSGPRVGVELL